MPPRDNLILQLSRDLADARAICATQAERLLWLESALAEQITGQPFPAAPKPRHLASVTR